MSGVWNYLWRVGVGRHRVIAFPQQFPQQYFNFTRFQWDKSPVPRKTLAVKSGKGWVRKPQRSVCRSHLVNFNQFPSGREICRMVRKWELCEPLICMRWNRKLGELWEFCFNLKKWKLGRHPESKLVLQNSNQRTHLCWLFEGNQNRQCTDADDDQGCGLDDGMYKGDAGVAAESRQASQGQFRTRLPLPVKNSSPIDLDPDPLYLDLHPPYLYLHLDLYRFRCKGCSSVSWVNLLPLNAKQFPQ